MDYFLARYYSSAQGRFTSLDEFTGGPTELFAEVSAHNPIFFADLAGPQSLNKYQYALNNPLRFVDPDGHQTTMADRVSLPTDNAASKVLRVAGRAREVTNSVILGPVGSQVSDAVGDGLDRASRLSNEVVFGSLGKTVNAIQGNPTVQLLMLAAGALGLGSDLMTNSAVRSTALSAANDVQGLPNSQRPGAAGALRTSDGQMFTATSGAGKLHPTVQQALDAMPSGQRSAGVHGKCCEPNLVSNALNAGANPAGSRINVVRVRRAGNAGTR